MLSGESLPVEKGPGDRVYAGTINGTGSIVYRCEATGADTVLQQIVRMVEEAQAGKAPIARMADAVSSWFVPVVIGIAILSGAAWLLAGESLSFALTAFTAVLVIACPCALGLATPTAIMVASGNASKRGILIKSPEALEYAGRAKVVIFDKTGTLTLGKPKIVSIQTMGLDENEVLRLAAAAEKQSEHPLAGAFLEAVSIRGLTLPEAESFEAVPGKGVRARISGKSIIAGTSLFLEEEKVLMDYKGSGNSEGTVIHLSIDGKEEARFTVKDEARPESAEAIRRLKKLGIRTILLSGDRRHTAEALAEELGIAEVTSEVLPAERRKSLKQSKRRKARPS
jgi:Cu+-exporting ATPase